MDVIKDVFGSEDRWVYKLGGQHLVSPKLTLRAGYNYSKAPIAKNRVAGNIFLGGVIKHHYTLGMSYDHDKQYLFSTYYSHGAQNTLPQTDAVSVPGRSPISTIKMSEQVIGLGVDFKF